MSEAVARFVLAKTLDFEGGIKDIGDGQGVTAFGQTPAWLSEFQLPAPETSQQAMTNYLAWLNQTRLMALCTLADPLAEEVIDFAVHADHRRAIRALQSVLGVAEDGALGIDTATAIGRCNRLQTAAGVLADRNAFNGRLLAQSPEKYSQFAAGWANRISAQIRRLVTA